LQLRGISTAITATALRNTSFSDGRQQLMQQSFHATRAGDVLVDFLPGWIIEDSAYRSSSDAGYRYDSNVPLIISGAGIAPKSVERRVNMVEIAPTLAKILGVECPWASSSRPIKEINN
jgi:arylsulfatase A-like enzyme